MIIGPAPEEAEAHMRRPIKFAITVAIMSLLALMLSEVGVDITGNDVAKARPKRAEHTITSNPYLPIRRLGPVW
jgi:hypothetical protein